MMVRRLKGAAGAPSALACTLTRKAQVGTTDNDAPSGPRRLDGPRRSRRPGGPVEVHVAAKLLRLATGGTVVAMQADLARWVGAAREVVSRPPAKLDWSA